MKECDGMSEPTIEELLQRMDDLYMDDWKITLSYDGMAVAEWGWWADGNPDEVPEGEEPTYEAGMHYAQGTLRDVLTVATREWTPGDRAGEEA